MAKQNVPQIITHAYLTQQLNNLRNLITAAASGVTSFNTRTGAVSFLLADGTGVGLAPLASPTFTSVPAAPTAAPGTNTTQIATTAFVLANAAPINSPTFTGTPTLPTGTIATTQVAGNNTTAVATTAFVTTATGGFLKADGSVAGASGAAQDFGTLGIKANLITNSTGSTVNVGALIVGLGDTQAAGNGTKITVTDSTQLLVFQSGTKYLSLNGATGLCQIGDMDANFNGQYIKIDNGAAPKTSIGDIDASGNGTFLVIDDDNETATLTADIGMTIITGDGTVDLSPDTGWTASTGTLSKAGIDSDNVIYTVGALQNLARTVAQIQTSLMLKGILHT